MSANTQKTLRTVAIIDVGTNSIKLLVASGSPDNGTLSTETFQRETSRIGAGLDPSGQISNNAQVRTINTLERFLQVIRQYDCDGVFIFSTYALRKAKNASAVVRRIKRETGFQVKMLTGEEEARYAYLSAQAHMEASKPHLYLIDVGGGSTEFVHAAGGKIVTTASLPLGALRLTERYIKTDPVSREDFAALRSNVYSAVSRLFHTRLSSKPAPGQADIVASGGSATTIKSMLIASPTSVGAAVMSGVASKIRIGDIRRIQESCLALPLDKRRRLPGLDPARADIIVAGLAVVTAFVETANKRILKINEGGVREGVALHVIQNNLQW